MDYRISTEYDGKKRKVYSFSCLKCSKEFWSPKHAKKKYCSQDCAYTSSRKRITVSCSFCGTSFEKKDSQRKNSRSGLFFCKRKCKDKAQQIGGIKELQLPHYGTGTSSYRTTAFRSYGTVCNSCGNEGIWREKPLTLDVHHIDGDRSNGRKENLVVLCPNCHRQEEMEKWARSDNESTLPLQGERESLTLSESTILW